MNVLKSVQADGVLIEPTTLQIQRLLPGPIERVWSYLTQSELRKQWLAAGEMEMKIGTPFELVWRNDELTHPPGKRPEGFGDEYRMQSQITELNPPHKLGFAWDGGGEVLFELEARGNQTLLTVTHRRIVQRQSRLMIGAGWHMHLDVLVARIAGTTTEPFWDGFNRLRAQYDQRFPDKP